jgi:hypothetical protein
MAAMIGSMAKPPIYIKDLRWQHKKYGTHQQHKALEGGGQR